MSEAVQPHEMRLPRRPRRLDRLQLISLAWTASFAVLTGALALALH